jgi:hypothetical protein
MKGDCQVLRYRPLPEGGKRTDLIDRLPDERNTYRDLRTGRSRRLGSLGIYGYRDGEEDHDGGNNPPEEEAFRSASKEISSGDHSVSMQLSFPARGILWEWIAVSTLAGRGFVVSWSLISGIVSFE